MFEQQHVCVDGTVMFLPYWLNRYLVVVCGFTVDELWICCGLFGVVGLVVGVLLFWVLRTIVIALIFVVLGVVLGVFIGGGILCCFKCGCFDTWLYWQLQWRIATCYLLMVGWVGGYVLILCFGFWIICRGMYGGV